MKTYCMVNAWIKKSEIYINNKVGLVYRRLFGQDSVLFSRDFNFLSHKHCEILYVTCLWLAVFMNVIIADSYECWEQCCPFSKLKSKQMNMTIISYSKETKNPDPNYIAPDHNTIWQTLYNLSFFCTSQ